MGGGRHKKCGAIKIKIIRREKSNKKKLSKKDDTVSHTSSNLYVNMSVGTICTFPVTKETARNWKIIAGKWTICNDAHIYVCDKLQVEPDDKSYAWTEFDSLRVNSLPMLCGITNDWGNYEMRGLLQLDFDGNLLKGGGEISTRKEDLFYFTQAGKRINHYGVVSNLIQPHAVCVPGKCGTWLRYVLKYVLKYML